MTSQWCKTANALRDRGERDWADLFSPFCVLLLLSYKITVTIVDIIGNRSIKEILPVGFRSEVSRLPEPQGRSALANFITQGVSAVPVTNDSLS